MADTYLYGSALDLALNKEVDWDDTNVKLALVQSGYTPDQDTHNYWDDVNANEVPNGNGYTTGGQAITTPTAAYVAAASATPWAATTAYQKGDVVRPVTPNGRIYMCVVAGTSGGSEPSWSTTPGANVTDNTVTWLEIGRGYVKVDGDDVTWSSSTITARYAVAYYSTGTPATSPLLAYVDFGGNQSSSNGNFTVAFDSTGIFTIPIR